MGLVKLLLVVIPDGAQRSALAGQLALVSDSLVSLAAWPGDAQAARLAGRRAVLVIDRSELADHLPALRRDARWLRIVILDDEAAPDDSNVRTLARDQARDLLPALVAGWGIEFCRRA